MSEDPREWFPVDADLWQSPGPGKLSWRTRLLAIYLRSTATPHGDRPNVALRTIPTMAEQTGLSARACKSGIATLESWCGDGDSPFIDNQDDGIMLRPVPRRFVRCQRWLWDSPLPFDIKDVVLFIRSRFAAKTPDGRDLFLCNLYGHQQLSIRQCCHLAGHGASRTTQVATVIKFLRKFGLVTEYRKATNRKPSLVLLNDKKPPPKLARIIGEADTYASELPDDCNSPGHEGTSESTSGNQQAVSLGTSEGVFGNHLKPTREPPKMPLGTSESVSGNHKSKSFSDSFSDSLLQSPFSNSSPDAAFGGRRNEIQEKAGEQQPATIKGTTPLPMIQEFLLHIEQLTQLRPDMPRTLRPSDTNYSTLSRRIKNRLRDEELELHERDVLTALRDPDVCRLQKLCWAVLLADTPWQNFTAAVRAAAASRKNQDRREETFNQVVESRCIGGYHPSTNPFQCTFPHSLLLQMVCRRCPGSVEVTQKNSYLSYHFDGLSAEQLEPLRQKFYRRYGQDEPVEVPPEIIAALAEKVAAATDRPTWVTLMVGSI